MTDLKVHCVCINSLSARVILKVCKTQKRDYSFFVKYFF